MQFLRPMAGVLMAILALHSLAAYFTPRLRPIPQYPPLVWLLRGVGYGGLAWVLFKGTYVNELAILIFVAFAGEIVLRIVSRRRGRELF
jgi:hypothetical protein